MSMVRRAWRGFANRHPRWASRIHRAVRNGSGPVAVARRSVAAIPPRARMARRALGRLARGDASFLLRHLRERWARPGASLSGSTLGQSNGVLPFPGISAVPRRVVRVGVIMDPFTTMAFAPEWVQVPVTPHNWRRVTAESPLDLVMLESAWAGNDDAWKYCLTGVSAPRPEVVQLLEWCRENGVPSCLWNKEDPAHFDDFLDTARLVDWVFTTDSDCVPRYVEALGHDRVAALPFAVQERICHPGIISDDHHSRGLTFAGTWFRDKFPERREQMRLLFDAAIAATERTGDTFDIYSRLLGGEARYQFPEPYAAHVVGTLSYNEMLSAYRLYRLFLNVNTVTTSPTMFARRVLEITACGTPVVSTPNPALATFLTDDGIALVDNPADAEAAIERLLTDPVAADRMVHLGQRHLWRHHTYNHRANQILDAVGLGHHTTAEPSISVISSTHRPEQVPHLLEQLARQTRGNTQVWLACHGFDVPAGLSEQAAERGMSLSALRAEDHLSLGECLNLLIERSDGDIITKMDDDDLYGPHYLEDLAFALGWSGADVVGKDTRYVHLAGADTTVLVRPGRSHRVTERVGGPTIMARGDLLRHLRFADRSRGEDEDFLRRVVSSGGRVHAADPHNFVQMRRADPSTHTWAASDEQFLRHPQQWQGLPEDLIFF